jgi:AGZA family xanthine/uracil permease-like MFS transporter
MNRYAWARWGDVNAFFGLILDNVAVMTVLVVLISSADPVADQRFSREFVLTQMIPGTVLGVVLGDLAYTWLAFRLARLTGRADVTAMPLGLDTPSTFAVGPLVLLPALRDGMARYGLAHDQAMVFAWHVAAVVLVMVGIFKSAVAPLGGRIRRWVPRAGLLGSLAGIALALIAFLPLWSHIAAVPVVGMASLAVILVTLVAHRPLPGHVPGALAAVLLGTAIFWIGAFVGGAAGWPIVPRLPARRAPPGDPPTCCRCSPATPSGGIAWSWRPWPACRSCCLLPWPRSWAESIARRARRRRETSTIRGRSF